MAWRSHKQARVGFTAEAREVSSAALAKAGAQRWPPGCDETELDSGPVSGTGQALRRNDASQDFGSFVQSRAKSD